MFSVTAAALSVVMPTSPKCSPAWRTSCITPGAIWEMRLLNLDMADVIDGPLENTLEGNKKNELMVKVDIWEESFTTNTSRLLTSTVIDPGNYQKPHTPPNRRDILVYRGTYTENTDLKISVKTIELDSRVYKAFSTLPETLESGMKLLGGAGASIKGIDNHVVPVTDLAGYVSRHLADKLGRDDLVIYHEHTFKACNSYAHSDNEFFFIEGIWDVVRLSDRARQSARKAWEDDRTKRPNGSSFARFRIAQRQSNPSGAPLTKSLAVPVPVQAKPAPTKSPVNSAPAESTPPEGETSASIVPDM